MIHFEIKEKPFKKWNWLSGVYKTKALAELAMAAMVARGVTWDLKICKVWSNI